jgi:hypothetical protein
VLPRSTSGRGRCSTRSRTARLPARFSEKSFGGLAPLYAPPSLPPSLLPSLPPGRLPRSRARAPGRQTGHSVGGS